MTARQKLEAAVALGRLGGQSRSRRKLAALRQNLARANAARKAKQQARKAKERGYYQMD